MKSILLVCFFVGIIGIATSAPKTSDKEKSAPVATAGEVDQGEKGDKAKPNPPAHEDDIDNSDTIEDDTQEENEDNSVAEDSASDQQESFEVVSKEDETDENSKSIEN